MLIFGSPNQRLDVLRGFLGGQGLASLLAIGDTVEDELNNGPEPMDHSIDHESRDDEEDEPDDGFASFQLRIREYKVRVDCGSDKSLAETKDPQAEEPHEEDPENDLDSVAHW